MLRLDDVWAWDFWLADDGEQHHLFFLCADRSLGDPDLRHLNARIGHAVSTDLRSWQRLPDALSAAPAPAFDDTATWTGSVVRGPDGTWHLFYTGLTAGDGNLVQTVGLATSPDLVTWTRYGDRPVAVADGRWYDVLGDTDDPAETWRDPWVVADPQGDGWHMLVTARSPGAPVDDRGVVGHARSQDLLTWEVQPPLSAPGAGFNQLEVLQVEVVDGRPVLVFSCLVSDIPARRHGEVGPGGVWAVAVDSVTGPYDVTCAARLTDDSLYSGRLVQERDGGWALLAFRNRGPDGFVGEITDPMPVAWDETGRLVVRA